jgi:SAM-dependent methyltransferase
MNFKDHFSTQAVDYAKYWLHYPSVLFAYLASIAPARKIAWDCGTGNGQAALGLAPHFDLVIATDPSEKQIHNAIPHEKIKYAVAPAERTDIAPQSVDLIMVAQALHWFDHEKFYAEVRRVSQPRGIIAVSMYNLLYSEPEITAVVNEFYFDIVGPHWPPERKLIESEYRTIPFPFAEIKPPPLSLAAQWNLDELLGYLNTWSATQRFISQNGFNPLEKIADRLAGVWGDPENKKRIEWPLHLRVGKVA